MTVKSTKCRTCRKALPPKARKYCSPECRAEARRRRQRVKRPAKRKCAKCGKLFQPLRRAKRSRGGFLHRGRPPSYCSQRCRQAAYMRALKGPFAGLKKAVASDLRNAGNPYVGRVRDEGYNAAMDGHARESNPYLPGSDYAKLWEQGFEGAQREIKSIEKEFRRLQD